ncbi:hypothetical protein FIBSPDRAFT_874070 [Athelia psychrophila]|uniref:Uncharacterized protein n=1 Tax=Athelia psychrophila TaxID=1759441 RepID=A0A165XUK3_9AGAM|nr:hypothetical protein FIBSPDRAFT_874070 [Fibularhizoctonia sp. CBS 109695]
MLPTTTRTVERVVRRGHPCIWRTLATEASVSKNASSASLADDPQFDRPTRGRGGKQQGPMAKVQGLDVSMAVNTIHVRAWKHPDSMAEAMAIVRGVEKKYGRLREFKWIRDWDGPQMYQSILWGSFHSSESLRRVPINGDTINIPAPTIDPLTPGGVGFHEMRQLLVPADAESVNEAHEHVGPVMKSILGGPEVISIKVDRALKDTDYYAKVALPEQPTMGRRVATAHALLDWGGFARLSPQFSVDHSPFNTDAGDVPADRENLRKVLNMAAQLTGRPDPSFAAPPAPEPVAPEPEVLEVESAAPEVVGPLAPPPATSTLASWSMPDVTTRGAKPIYPATAPQYSATGKQEAPKLRAAPAAPRKQFSKAKRAMTPKEELRPKAELRPKQKQPEQLTTSAKRPRTNSVADPEGLKGKVMQVLGKWF